MNPAPSRSAFAPGWLPGLNRPDICRREGCLEPATDHVIRLCAGHHVEYQIEVPGKVRELARRYINSEGAIIGSQPASPQPPEPAHQRPQRLSLLAPEPTTWYLPVASQRRRALFARVRPGVTARPVPPAGHARRGRAGHGVGGTGPSATEAS